MLFRSRWNGVEEIRYQGEWLDLLNRLLNFLRLGGIWLGGLLILGVLAIVSTIVQLTVYGRREEIQILRFMGATDRFIMAPFFIEGLLIGLMGSVFSLSLLIVFFELFQESVTGDQGIGGSLRLIFLSQKVMLSMLLGGVVLGCLGSLLSVRGVLRQEG